MVRFTLIFAAIFALGCSGEKVQVVDDELQPFVEDFFEEGRKRGFGTNLEDIDLVVEFGEVVDDALGQCNTKKHIVTIASDEWPVLNAFRRRLLVYHELGHCVLGRGHRNDASELGDCISIMRGAEEDFKCSLNIYSDMWWDYYLDEMFDTDSSIPVWDSSQLEYGTLDPNWIAFQSSGAFYEIDLDVGSSVANDNFNITCNFTISETEIHTVALHFGNLYFTICDNCTESNIEIGQNTNPIRLFYQNLSDDLTPGENVKLSIRHVNDLLHFYLNQQYLHTCEYDLWSGDPRLRTNIFEEPIEMRLTVHRLFL